MVSTHPDQVNKGIQTAEGVAFHDKKMCLIQKR
jgi:hypothetical protein